MGLAVMTHHGYSNWVPDADPTQLPHLLKLLDDEAPETRRALSRAFSNFGPQLKDELDKLSPSPTDDQRHLLQWLLEEDHRNWVLDAWPAWTQKPEGVAKLEAGYELISRFQTRLTYDRRLPALLDTLADEYSKKRHEPEVRSLAEFLFKEYGLRGAKAQEFYDPLNSDLVYVIHEKRGLPISLATIYILIGDRLGLTVQGLNFPGHFLARVTSNDRPLIIDCFNGGKFFSEEEIIATHRGPEESLRRMLRSPADASTILSRVLRNLVAAYERAQRPENARFAGTLLETLERS